MKFLLPAARLWALRLALLTAATCTLPATSSAQASDAPTVQNSSMTGELLYEILLGELNVRQGESVAGFSLLLDAARKSNDVQLYDRAVEIALQARSGDGALMAARAWSQAWPQDRKANNQVLQILLALNQVAASLEPLKKELALAPDIERDNVINLMPRHYARVTDKKRATHVVEMALEPYLNKTNNAASAWTTVGRMRISINDMTGALDAAKKGQSADTKAQGPVLLALELIGKKMPEAEALVTLALRRQEGTELAMGYVRVLIELERYTEASEQLQAITRKDPKLADAWLVLGSLQFEQGQDNQAEASLARYVALAAQDTTDNSTRGLTQAQTRRAALLARQGKMDQARQLITQLPVHSAEEQRNRLLVEVQLLRDHRQWQAAFDLLATNSGNDVDLMYEQAMLAEKLDRVDEMEKLLRAVFSQNPSYYNAYNALGFSLADRNVRLPEAKQLIIKALALAPDDPFITDSLGWVEFRLGNLGSALSYLQKAYKDRADAEIAAHLGEVLWKMKRQEEAIQIWREGLKTSPNNETLQETLQRLKPTL
ncbi:tetratricopeptide repeat protein [Limnohabitans sp.]|uniref:tetratricopeptide repeat protein n=1 Tax=Limnohabitans sp. TaxID=1907725 RepID=UPI00286F7E4F|nr:tetratricopeptide repeat protein [Limnohabitans sp.]